jgi:hypothetical protein
MNNEQQQKEPSVPLKHPTGIREHTDGREFRPFALLSVTIVIAVVIAIICYAVQMIFIGPS